MHRMIKILKPKKFYEVFTASIYSQKMLLIQKTKKYKKFLQKVFKKKIVLFILFSSKIAFEQFDSIKLGKNLDLLESDNNNENKIKINSFSRLAYTCHFLKKGIKDVIIIF